MTGGSLYLGNKDNCLDKINTVGRLKADITRTFAIILSVMVS